MSSAMAVEDYGADGTAETEVTAVAMPTDAFLTVFGKSTVFRMFAFEN